MCSRNFLGVKVSLHTLLTSQPTVTQIYRKSDSLDILQPYGTQQPVTWTRITKANKTEINCLKQCFLCSLFELCKNSGSLQSWLQLWLIPGPPVTSPNNSPCRRENFSLSEILPSIHRSTNCMWLKFLTCITTQLNCAAHNSQKLF